MPLSDEDTVEHAVDIANQIEAVLHGRDYAAALMALGMVIGMSVMDAQRPNLEATVQLLRRQAAATMRQQRAERGRAH